jgi:hypothetical protein
MPTANKTTEFPAAALKMRASVTCFAAPVVTEVDAPSVSDFPVKLRIRDAGPINHWYWGQIVHDFAGIERKTKTPIDYCHNDDEILGFISETMVAPDGLDATGILTQFEATDRVAEIVSKSSRGVPYESSIFFDPLTVEELLPGAKTVVNGLEITGPALIVRRWKLRGVAICPYGADPGTETEFKQTYQFSTTQPNTPTMSQTTTTPTDPKAEFAATLAKFSKVFGPERAAKFAVDGTNYETALESHIADQVQQLTAAQTKIADLETKLAAIPRGAESGVSFSGTDGKIDPNKYETNERKEPNKLSTGLEKFAASIKLPK